MQFKCTYNPVNRCRRVTYTVDGKRVSRETYLYLECLCRQKKMKGNSFYTEVTELADGLFKTVNGHCYN